MANENLGPADRILKTVLQYVDHAVHNRPGIVQPDATNPVGVKWLPVTHVVEDGEKIVYELRKVGNKTTKIRLGKMQDDGRVKDVNRIVGRYQPAGIFQEVATWLYQQVAEVWKLDNEFAAKWASYAFEHEKSRDLKVILAAFLLVQSRKGDPVLEDGTLAFHDEDFRDVGEAMLLLDGNKDKGIKHFDAKLLLRVRDVLMLPGVVEINRQLGFGRSTRNAFLGRWPGAVDKWLRYREENPKMLEGLVKGGWRRSIIELASRIGYKPTSLKFFEILRWKQSQADDGRRTMAIGVAVKAAESWEGLSEEQICETIVRTKPNFKRLVGLLPKGQGLTRAIVAAAIEAGSLSDKDLIIATPTLEDLGLMEVPEIKARWEQAVKNAEDMRAANIASRVRSKDTQEKLNEAADNAVKAAVAEVVKGIRIYFVVDISGSMNTAIQQAKAYLAKFLQAFPLEQIHVSVFNTVGKEIAIKHNSKAGIENAFKGINASGGTSYGEGVQVLKNHKPNTEEDVLFVFVGDEAAGTFAKAVRESGLNPLAFGFLYVAGNQGRGNAVLGTANELGIPCFTIDEKIFSDPYAVPRTIRALIAATPVGRTAAQVTPRVSLVDTILATKMLSKPAWA